MAGYKYTEDVRLSNNSVIAWSRRKKTKVPVICGSCGHERWLYVQNVTVERFTGFCYECSFVAKRKHTEMEVLETGSVIYWNERQKPGRDEPIPIKCGICGDIRTMAASRIPNVNFTGYCVDCARTGERSHFWKGGRFQHPSGYILVRLTPDHKFYSMADSHHLVPEHRLVMAEHVNRYLRNDEIVHHKNGIKNDNRLENLELLDRRLHHTGYNAPELDENNVETELLGMVKNLLATVFKVRRGSK